MLRSPPTNDNTIIPDMNRFYQTWVKWFESIKTEVNTISGGGP